MINKLKHILPSAVLLTLYNSLILPHLNYGILAWGTNIHRISLLQKRAIRIICLKKYNAHTAPLFKCHDLLSVNDIYKLQCLKFFYRYVNNSLPTNLQTFSIIPHSERH